MEIYLGMPGRDGHDGFWMKEVVSIAKMLAKWCAVYGLGKLTATLIRKWITSDIHAKAGHSRLVLADFDVPAGGGGFNNRSILNVPQPMQPLAGHHVYVCLRMVCVGLYMCLMFERSENMTAGRLSVCVVNCLCGVCLYVVCLGGLKNDRGSPFLWACELFVWVFPGKRLYKPTFTRHTKAQPTRTSYEKVTESEWGNWWSNGVRKATSTPCGRLTAITTSRKPRKMRRRGSAFRRRWLRHVYLQQVFCLE